MLVPVVFVTLVRNQQLSDDFERARVEMGASHEVVKKLKQVLNTDPEPQTPNLNPNSKPYIPNLKLLQVYDACELELKLASKGSISAATLSEKTSKLNASRDKYVDDSPWIRCCFVTLQRVTLFLRAGCARPKLIMCRCS